MNERDPKRNLLQIGLIVVLMVSLNGITVARSFDQYVRDIDLSRVELRPFTADDTDLSDEGIAKKASEALNGIRARLPEKDEIQINEETITVDNFWLKRTVEEYESEQRPAYKLVLLKSLRERLDAIFFRVSGLSAIERRKTSKDEEKRKLNEILKGEEYSIAGAGEESPAARFYGYLMEWLRSVFPQSEPLANQKGLELKYLQNGLQVFIYLLAAGLVGYVILRFGPQLVRRYRSEREIGQKQLILGEEIAADATTEDLFSDAERLARSGDIRGAIRKGYISLLFELGRRSLIGLAKHKTNRDYLRDISKDKHLQSNVGVLTKDFENIWYGNRAAHNEDWEDFKASYRDVLG